MKKLAYLFLTILFFCLAASATSPTIPPDSQTVLKLYLTPQAAYQKMTQQPQNILFVDIRTPAEIHFNGMPTIADVNIPFENIDTTKWSESEHNFSMQQNPKFEAAIAQALQNKKLNKQSPIFLICRSAKRSAVAANLLAKYGYTNVYNILEGFEGDAVVPGAKKGLRIINGWKNSGLPWTTKLDKSKVFNQ